MTLHTRSPSLLSAGAWERLVITLAALLLGGTVGYRLIEGIGWLDALYMTVITVTTVGYEEVVPLSDTGRVFTILLVLGGVFVVFFVAGGLLGPTLIQNLPRSRKRSMQKAIDALQDHVILCGYGRLGEIVRHELDRAARSYVIIEKDPARVEELRGEDLMVLEGDATDEEVLLAAGVERASGVIAAVHTDADNVFITMVAREHGPGCCIIARAEDPRTASKLKLVGATQVVTPYVLGGRRLAQALLRPSVVDLADLVLGGPGHEVLLEEVELPETVPEQTSLASLDVGRRFGLIAVGTRREGENRLRFNPGARSELHPGDSLLVMGLREQLDAFQEHLDALPARS